MVVTIYNKSDLIIHIIFPQWPVAPRSSITLGALGQATFMQSVCVKTFSSLTNHSATRDLLHFHWLKNSDARIKEKKISFLFTNK